MSGEFCLKWNNYQSALTTEFKSLQEDENFVDVTLSAEGKTLKAHKVILSACSPYFRQLLAGISSWQHPVLVLSQLPFQDLSSILDFVYLGQVNVVQENLQSFLKVAELLKIKGLTEEFDHEKHNSEGKPEIPPRSLPDEKKCAKRSKPSPTADPSQSTTKDPLSSLHEKRSRGYSAIIEDSDENVLMKEEPGDTEVQREGENYDDREGEQIVGEDPVSQPVGTLKPIETVNCLVCRATLSNSNALYYHMNYVHSTQVRPLDFIRKITQSEDIVKQEGE